jgi:hypothetical protein|tara:strand:- start:285 stop:485 length:201 start_codon:yes stop_codon:yes gene_type:complete
MAGNSIITEKAGQSLKVDYFETDNGAGIRCFINGDFTSEELYEGKDIAFASAAAQRWVAGINTLNG